jgi:uncharacterized membrane protein
MVYGIIKTNMGTLRDAKLFGGIGSILKLFIPIVGEILIIIAAKHLSEVTKDESIFKNVLYAMIFIILGSIVSVAVLYGSLFAAIMMFGNFFAILASIFLFLIVAFIFYLLGAIFLKRGFERIAEIFNVGYFRTAALLYLIGAVLIIVIVGGIVIFVATIFMIIAFFSLPEQLPPQPQQLVPPPPT